MTLRDIFFTASANMFHSKMRTILTILAIFIGAFTLTLTNGISSGISSYVDKQINNLGQKDLLNITAKSTSTNVTSDTPQKYEPGKQTGGRGEESFVFLTQKDIDTLKADKDLTNVQASFVVSPDYIQGTNAQKYKLSVSQIGGSANLDLAAGKELDMNAKDNELVLPIMYISSLGYTSAADSIGKIVTVAVTDATGIQHTLQATIVGVQQKGLVGASGAAFNNTLKDNLYNQQSTGLPNALKNKYASATAHIVGSLSDAHITSVKDHLSSLGFSGQTLTDVLGAFKSVINVITWVLRIFAIIALLAASFGIVNTLLMSVQERTKEIGLMKAMGMPSGRIFLLFSTEAVLIGFWGSAIGSGIAIVVGQVANRIVSHGVLKDLPGFELLLFPIQSIVLVIVLIMFIAFLAGTLPAIRAARQNPIDALRYE